MIRTVFSIFLWLWVSHLTTFGQPVSFDWVNVTGGHEGLGGVFVYRVAIEENGDVYVLGTFNGQIDLDPGIDTLSAISNGATDVFIQKLNSQGGLIWAKTFGGAYYEGAAFAGPGGGTIENGLDMIITDSGSLLISGTFDESSTGSDSVDFNPDPLEEYNILTAGGSDIFLMKLSSSGEFLWAKGMGGGGDDRCWAVELDETGSIFIAGGASDSADFSPDILLNDVLIGNGDTDAYICKLDSAGEFLWLRSWGSSGKEEVLSVKLAESGGLVALGGFNVYGMVEDSIDLNPSPIEEDWSHAVLSSNNLFLVNLNEFGEYEWGHVLGVDPVRNYSSLCLSPAEEIILVGWFSDTVDFDPSQGIQLLSTTGEPNSFALKFNLEGGFQSVEKFGTPFSSGAFSSANCITPYLDGFAIVGGYWGNVNMNTDSIELDTLSAYTGSGNYIMLLDSELNHVWSGSYGSDIFSSSLNTLSLVSSEDNLCYGGLVRGDATITDYDPGIAESLMPNIGINGGFVVKLDGLQVSHKTNSGDLGVTIHPNPSHGKYVIRHDQSVEIRGINVYSVAGFSVNHDINHAAGQIDLDVDHSDGIFIIEILTQDNPIQLRVIKTSN